MQTVGVLAGLGYIVAVSAWPQQSRAEIEAEADRDARIFKEMQVDIHLNPLQQKALGEMDGKRGLQDTCQICPTGQHFHPCNIGGMTAGKEWNCKQALEYLHDGASDDECKSIQGLTEKCCNPTIPTPETCDVPTPPGPACTPVQEKVECINGLRPAGECARSWDYNGKRVDGYYAGWTKYWCSHDAIYTSSSNTSECQPCREAVAADQPKAKWGPAIESIRCLFAIANSGDAKERVFEMENGGPGTQEVFPAFSAGKWPSTVTIAGVVRDGHLTWDTKASDVFDWWTKDPNDPRSRVTLANLLNFVDGFVNIEGTFQFTNDVWGQRCLTPGLANYYTPESCAKQIYETAHFAGVEQDTYMNATNPGAEPGTWFDYNSYHQQIALGMATKATGMDARDLLKKYVLGPAGMQDSYWLGGANPCLSGFLQTTTDDYDRFLRAHAGYKLIPKDITDRTEMLVHGAEGTKVKQYGTNNMIPFENFAMGMYQQDGFVTMGGNIGNALNRETNHYSMIAYSGWKPYQFDVLMQVYSFHKKVEEVWKGAQNIVV